MYNDKGGSSKKLAHMLSPEESGNEKPRVNGANQRTPYATGQDFHNDLTPLDATGNKYYYKESSGNIDIVSGQNTAKEAIDLPAQKFLLIDTEKKQVHGYSTLLDLFQGYFLKFLTKIRHADFSSETLQANEIKKILKDKLKIAQINDSLKIDNLWGGGPS